MHSENEHWVIDRVLDCAHYQLFHSGLKDIFTFTPTRPPYDWGWQSRLKCVVMQLEGALQRPGNHACSDLAVIKFPLSKWENAFFKPNFAESIERVTKPVVRCRGVQENGFFAPVASESPEKT